MFLKLTKFWTPNVKVATAAATLLTSKRKIMFKVRQTTPTDCSHNSKRFFWPKLAISELNNQAGVSWSFRWTRFERHKLRRRLIGKDRWLQFREPHWPRKRQRRRLGKKYFELFYFKIFFFLSLNFKRRK